jgi:hypothetical protein
MQIFGRKKMLFFSIGFLILLAFLLYFFRYSLVLQFQYTRLKELKCQATTQAESCLQRVWVHRVNSLERYEFLKNKFSGFEVDIVFHQTARNFFVYHPPLVSAWKDTLSLQNFFDNVDLSKKQFWLDMRGVYSFNVKEALETFSSLTERYSLRSSCILEIYDPTAASIFAQNGYAVSFNVSELAQQTLSNVASRDSLRNLLEPVKYVSQEAHFLPFMKEMFPEKKVVTWQLSFKNFFDVSPIEKLLEDPAVAVVLVNIKSAHYR